MCSPHVRSGSHSMPIKGSIMEDNRECTRCKGTKIVSERVRDLGTLNYANCFISCPTCDGKGYITEEDIENYYRSFIIE